MGQSRSPHGAKRQRIAVDLDGVLADYEGAFTEFSNKLWSPPWLRPQDYHENWDALWQVSDDEVIRRRRVLDTVGLVGMCKPIDEALPVLIWLKQMFELHGLTSRPESQRKISEQWLGRSTNFRGVLEELHFTGIFNNPTASAAPASVKRTKAEKCLEIGADFLIDNELKHCRGAAEVGVRTVLFDRWGRYDELLDWQKRYEQFPHGNMAKVRSWAGIGAYFELLAQARPSTTPVPIRYWRSGTITIGLGGRARDMTPESRLGGRDISLNSTGSSSRRSGLNCGHASDALLNSLGQRILGKSVGDRGR